MRKEKNDTEYVSYPVFKGLQKPLEFLIFQGRYISWAAYAAGGAILGFIVAYCIFGFVAGLIAMLVSIAIGGGMIMLRQRKGLHTKKEDHGVFIYHCSRRM